NYLMGVCVVGTGNKIEYLNPKGLEILKYKSAEDIKGKDYKDIFLLTDETKEAFWQRYFKKDPSLDALDIKLGDDSENKVQAALTFVVGEKGIEVCGITFEAAPAS
ncbi:MAG: PAS domain-containing protein, partial [Desulfobacterales bacterium]